MSIEIYRHLGISLEELIRSTVGQGIANVYNAIDFVLSFVNPGSINVGSLQSAIRRLIRDPAPPPRAPGVAGIIPNQLGRGTTPNQPGRGQGPNQTSPTTPRPQNTSTPGTPINAPTSHGGLRREMDRLGSPPSNIATPQAHHSLPWHYREWFAKRGLNVNDPQFGAWVDATPGLSGNHQSWSRAYNQEWSDFIRDNFYTASADAIKNKLNSLRVDPRWGGGF